MFIKFDFIKNTRIISTIRPKQELGFENVFYRLGLHKIYTRLSPSDPD